MKNFFVLWLLAFGLLSGAASAQNRQPTPPANLQGVALRDWLRQNWYDPYRVVLSYATARGKMYNYADNYNNQVTCVYSGYVETVPYSTTNTSTGVVNQINCEHTVPQSWFNQVVRMRTDMHHLFPTFDTWNNLRGSDPFAEIADASTLTWMRNTTSQPTIPTTAIDEWSEDTNTQFEPREDHKGNLARSIFYFYTMHGGQPELAATGHSDINTVGNINTLYQWHLADPVDAREIERDRRVAVSQGNYNPYIYQPSLVATAWGLAPAGPAITFATATGTRIEGNTASTYTVTLNLASTLTSATTVQVNVDATNSTATNGSDFTYTSPTTVTFAAGQTTATTTVTINGDTQPELDETVVLTLTNPSTNASIGNPSGHTLTLTNDDGAAPTVSFAAASGSLVEGNAGTSPYTVNVTLTTPGSVTFPLTVPVTVTAASTTASSPADYTLTTTTVTFPNASSLTQPVNLTIVGDLLTEANETVALTLGTPSATGVIIGTRTHTLIITNDDITPAGAPCSRLFFTQYIESSTGNTKALEIYNPSAGSMSLAGKRVELFANGITGPPTATLALTGTIAGSGTYVIANTGVTDMGVAAVANIQSNVAFFNGNDAIVLYDGTDTLDIIGVVGQQPASWSTSGGGSTLNNTLVRLPDTEMGGHWNSANGSGTWISGGVDVFTGLGSYTSTACPLATATRAATVRRDDLEIYPNPASETVRLRLPGVPTARPATVEVLDMLGRPVRTRTAVLSATDATQVDLRGLTPGLYAVRVRCAEVEYTGRIVVR